MRNTKQSNKNLKISNKVEALMSTALTIILVPIIILIMSIPDLLRYALFYAPKSSESSDPCPIPDGSYTYTCTQIQSKLIDDGTQCIFTATCDTGLGKRYSAWEHHTFGPYGDKCPEGLLLVQQLTLPLRTQFRDFTNMQGRVESTLSSGGVDPLVTFMYASTSPDNMVFTNRTIKGITDENCELRLQLSAANPTAPSAAIAAVVALGTLKLMS
jgi:hypothetical protein